MEDKTRLDRLTDREKESLRHWLQHKTAKEIALDLGVSHHAIEKRLKMARTKLGVGTSIEAARMLQAAEGYGMAVAGLTDLPIDPNTGRKAASRSFVIGAIVVSLILAVVLSATLPSVEQEPEYTQSELVTRMYDEQLKVTLNALLSAAEVGPDGEVLLTSAIGDPRFLEPDSGFYWQISAKGHEHFTSRSLWDRSLRPSRQDSRSEAVTYASDQFEGENLRILERTVRLAGSDVSWRFIVARTIDESG